MTAKKMFEELGYEQDFINKNSNYKTLRYKDDICFTTIHFYYGNRSVSINNLKPKNYNAEFKKMYKAIQKQIEELGWQQ
jgi:hypothetical protein